MKRDAAVAAVFKPVHAPTAFEETVERLGTAIRTGVLAAGSQLPPERQLATQLRISRSTLRQALTTLVQSGHLTSTRGRRGGTFVVERPPLAERTDEPLGDRARAVLDLRVAVELGSVTLAIERADDEELGRLAGRVEAMEDPDDFDDYRRADIGFHLAIAQAARSPQLLQEMSEVQAQLSDLLALIAHPPEVLAHANSQHGRLVRLLMRRDHDRAARLMREHIEGTEHIIAGLV